MYVCNVRTLDVEENGIAFAVALLVAAHAGVEAGARPRHRLQHQTLIADYCAGARVVHQHLSLQRDKSLVLIKPPQPNELAPSWHGKEEYLHCDAKLLCTPTDWT
jgi:hypothetical protein